jgi:hypothetical protein
MFYLLYFGYFLGLAVNQGEQAGLAAGISVFGAGLLTIIAGSGLRGSLTRTTLPQKIVGIVLAAILASGAIYLTYGYDLHAFGYTAPLWQWALAGAVASFAFARPFVPRIDWR